MYIGDDKQQQQQHQPISMANAKSVFRYENNSILSKLFFFPFPSSRTEKKYIKTDFVATAADSRPFSSVPRLTLEK